MSKSEQIKELLSKLNSNENQLELIKSIDEIVTSENKKYDTYSKLIYDIFLDILTDYKTKNYSFSAYKSWFIKYDNLELCWDGRDEYLFLWDVTDGNKKTIKVIEADKINYQIISEFNDLISIHKLINS
jgi:hypothetical protein